MKANSLKFELQKKIEALEIKQKSELNLLKLQLEHSYESLNPIHLLKDFIEDSFLKPTNFKSSIIKTLISSTGSILLKKIIVGKTNTLTGKIVGSFFQLVSFKALNKFINK